MARQPWLTAIIGAGLAAALLVGSPAPAPPPPTPVADAGILHHVFRTGGDGVWLHDVPRISDGLLVVLPEGAAFYVSCWTEGEAVNGNPVWLYGSSPYGTGLVTDYYIDTRWNTTADLTAQGIAPCGSSESAVAASVSSVFFSPIAGEPHGHGPTFVADRDLARAEWTNETCDASQAFNQVPATATALSGWSAGRLGPMYFLSNASPEEAARINTIVLYDPGNHADMAASCDSQINPSGLIARWLNDNPDSRLIVLAGTYSEDRNWLGDPKFGGLWEYYFADVWETPASDRVMVCNYTGMEHFNVLNLFRTVTRQPPSSCPSSPDGTSLIQWSP